MRRFFVPHIDISKKEFTISDPIQVHHIKDVLRFKPKDAILIFDAEGNEYKCLIKSFDSKKIAVMDVKLIKAGIDKKALTLITLACAIPKKGKFDYIVEKTTELGVDTIIPMITERSIVRLDCSASDNKLSRWRRIAVEASKQCARSDVPEIEDTQDFYDITQRFDEFDAILLPNLSEKERIPITKAVEKLNTKKNILVLIGPEGDFSEKELDAASAKNVKMLSLGKRILKVETAAILCVGLLCLHLK